MRKLLKWIGIGLGAIVGLLVVAFVSLSIITAARFNRTYDVPVSEVAIPDDAAAIARGQHIAENISACTACHGANLGGDILINDAALGTISPANLTSGQGGIGDSYSDADYVRALRNGIGADGKPLLIMPANEFRNMSAADLGAVIAYLKSVAPVDNELPETRLGIIGRILFLTSPEALPAIVIDHDDTALPTAPAEGATQAYGEYLVSIATCAGCHGAQFNGTPGREPGAPPALNLTPAGELIGWTTADFVNTIRNGVTPGGHMLDSEQMPWEFYAGMTDDELAAIFLYLQSLPAVENGY